MKQVMAKLDLTYTMVLWGLLIGILGAGGIETISEICNHSTEWLHTRSVSGRERLVQTSRTHRMDNCRKSHSFIVDFSVRSAYAGVLRILLEKLGWSTIILISDGFTDVSVDDIAGVITESRGKYIHYGIGATTNDDEIGSWINKTYFDHNPSTLRFIVVCNDNNTQRVVNLAGQYDDQDKGRTALFYFSRWLIITHRHGGKCLTEYVGELDHLAVLVLPDRTTSKNNVQGIPSPACSCGRELCEAGNVEVWTVLYKPAGKVLNCIGHWQNESLDLIDEVFPNSKFGFNSRSLLVGTNMWPPFVYQRNESGSVTYTGYSIDLLKEVAKSLNFSYTLKVPDDKEWGQLKYGKWTGVIGDLYYKKIDLLAAPMARTTFREQACDFTSAYFYEYNVVIIRRPSPSSYKWRTLLDIFSWQVLVCIFASLPVCAAIAYLLENFNYIHKPKLWAGPSSHMHSYAESIWNLFGALLCQGGVLYTESASGRTVIGVWRLYCLVVTATFTGQLMATLTSPSRKSPFEDLSGMVKQEDFIWGTTGGGTVVLVSLETSRDRTFQEVWKGIKRFNETDKDVLSTDYTTHLRKVNAGGYAFLADKSSVSELVSSNCEVKTLKEEYFPIQYAFALPEGSPFTDMFSERISIAEESGLLKSWKKNWWPMNHCTGLPRTQAVSICLADVQSAYFLLLAGTFLGLITMLFECIVKAIDRRST